LNPDPFDELGLHPAFEIDSSRIEAAYLSRAAAMHPDLAGDDPESSDRASALNWAKAILDHPEKRADALLIRRGGPTKEADKSLPAGFLMSILETREQVEEAVTARDPVAIGRWRAWAHGQRSDFIGRVGAMFMAIAQTADPRGLARIRHELNAWRYIERLIEQLEPGYDPGDTDPWA